MVKKFIELEERMSPEARQRVASRVEHELKQMENAGKETSYERLMPEMCGSENNRPAVNA